MFKHIKIKYLRQYNVPMFQVIKRFAVKYAVKTAINILNVYGIVSRTYFYCIGKIKFENRKSIIYDIDLVDRRYSTNFENEYVFPFEEVCETTVRDVNGNPIQILHEVYDNIKNCGTSKNNSFLYFSELKYFTGLPEKAYAIRLVFFPWIVFDDGSSHREFAMKSPLRL
jgi:hypothetical protein